MSGSDEASGEAQTAAPRAGGSSTPNASGRIAGGGQRPAVESAPADARNAKPMKVVVYSHNAATRDVIRLAIGRRPAPDVPPAEIIECATEPALFRRLDRGGDVDIMILDGEAQPAGGMGVCRQAKDEIYDCPPVLLIIGRADDGWLATWSRADAVVSQPIDPAAVAGALAGLMRQLLSAGDTGDAGGGVGPGRVVPHGAAAGAGGSAPARAEGADGADSPSGALHEHDAPAQA